jgi:hypothetical protein
MAFGGKFESPHRRFLRGFTSLAEFWRARRLCSRVFGFMNRGYEGLGWGREYRRCG